MILLQKSGWTQWPLTLCDSVGTGTRLAFSRCKILHSHYVGTQMAGSVIWIKQGCLGYHEQTLPIQKCYGNYVIFSPASCFYHTGWKLLSNSAKHIDFHYHHSYFMYITQMKLLPLRVYLIPYKKITEK